MKGTQNFQIGLVFDKYTRQARLKPALLTLLPIFVTVAVWLPKVWALLGGLAAMIIAFGLTVLLAEVARFQGRRVERAMIAANGGKFTTILLRHRDTTISVATKKSYHAFLKTASKRSLPSFQNEEMNPTYADECYRGAVDWLLENTRNEVRFPLVRAENISYGFRRNLLGLKAPAVVIVVICVAANVLLCVRNIQNDPTRMWAGALVSAALLGVGLLWIFVIKMSFVEDAGRCYALRLLAQCDVLRRSSSRKPANE